MSDFDWTPHLEPGEELLWSGRPNTRIRFFHHWLDFFIVTPTFTWCTAAILFVLTAFARPNPDLTAMLALAAAFPMALRIAIGRGIRDQAIRKRLRYALSRQRVLRADTNTGEILTQKPITPELKIDATPKRLTNIQLDPYQAGGDIPYSTEPKLHWTLATLPRPRWLRIFYPLWMWDLFINGYRERGLELRLIPDGPKVVALLKTLKSEAPEGEVPC